MLSRIGPQGRVTGSKKGIMVNDPLSDLLSRVKNGYRAKMPEVRLPWSRTKEAVAKVLAEHNFVEKVTKQDQILAIVLKYNGREPALTDIRRVSKPGVRIYSKVKKLPRVLGGIGVNILSTPKGIMGGKQAKKLNVGGEIIAQVW